MNSESVDRQVSSMLDSESLDRLGLSVVAFQKITRRAFSALRVIRIEGKITSIMLQNNRYFFATKMLPAQNL